MKNQKGNTLLLLIFFISIFTSTSFVAVTSFMLNKAERIAWVNTVNASISANQAIAARIYQARLTALNYNGPEPCPDGLRDMSEEFNFAACMDIAEDADEMCIEVHEPNLIQFINPGTNQASADYCVSIALMVAQNGIIQIQTPELFYPQENEFDKMLAFHMQMKKDSSFYKVTMNALNDIAKHFLNEENTTNFLNAMESSAYASGSNLEGEMPPKILEPRSISIPLCSGGGGICQECGNESNCSRVEFVKESSNDGEDNVVFAQNFKISN